CQQRRDGSQRHPARSDSLHVVLLYGSGADTRPACELHTHKLWQSHADPDSHGYSHGDGNSDSNAYRDANADANADSYSHAIITSGYSDANTYCEAHCDTTAAADAAAKAVEIFAGAKTSSD